MDTRRHECQVHGIHKYCHEISVCSTCHFCIRLIRVFITGTWKCLSFHSFACGFWFWSNFFGFSVLDDCFYGFVVFNTPQCPLHHLYIGSTMKKPDREMGCWGKFSPCSGKNSMNHTCWGRVKESLILGMILTAISGKHTCKGIHRESVFSW